MDMKVLRAVLWFIAAGFFIFSLLNADEEAFNERHQPVEEVR